MKTYLLYSLLGISLALGSDLIPPEVIKKQALEIDKLVAANFRENKIAVPDVTDDSTFLRRAFLVSVGRIPTPKEALQFLELEHPDKRELLTEYLFTSDGYKSHMTNWIHDLLTLREFSGPTDDVNNMPLIHWVKDAIEINMTWDDFCQKLLTSKGNAWLTTGAAGYFAKDKSMQEDNLANTMRIFTGMRMECAQCHDDPFQEWERMDFYQLNAFVNGATVIKPKANFGSERGNLQAMMADNKELYWTGKLGQITNLYDTLSRYVEYGVPESKGNGRVKIPSDWQYRDADPGEYVGGRTPFGPKLKTDDDESDADSIQKFADWMVSTQHFDQTIALRLWERIMGISLTPTTGDFVEPRETEFPKLIIHLSKLIKDYDYDIKVFQKTLMQTKTFQFVSSKKELKNGDKRALDGRRASRMSAEQIWDSLLSLTVPDPEALPKRQRMTDFYYGGSYIMSMRDMVTQVRGMSALQLKNYVIKLYSDLRDGKEIAKPESSSSDASTMSMGRAGGSGALNGLVRASELASPAPSGHFLSTFGQSTRRSAIDEASKEGAVAQALELLNGSVQKLIVHNKDASVNQVVDQIDNPEQRIRTIFLVVLNRAPDADELQMCLDLLEVSEDEDEAYRNLTAGLIASQEFYFVF